MTTPHSLRRSVLGTPTSSRVNHAFKSPFRSPLPNLSGSGLVSNDSSSPLGLNTESCSKSVESNETPKESGYSSVSINENSSDIANNKSNSVGKLDSIVEDRKFNNPRHSLKRQYPGDNSGKQSGKAFQIPFKSPLLKCEASPGISGGQSPKLEKTVTKTSHSSETSTPKRPFVSRLSNRGSKKKSTSSNSLQEFEQLIQQEKDLDKEISDLELEGYNIKELQTHIEKLHRYNDLKDTAQMVMGQLAVMENDSVKNMHERYEVANLD